MAWVRIDDQAPRHRKMLKAGPAANWLWVCAIAHCQSQLTNGFVSWNVLPMIGVAGVARCKRLAESLVSVGLFDRADGGYNVHDYLIYNDTREEAQQKRSDQHDVKVRAGLAGSRARWQKDSRPIADGNSRGIADPNSRTIALSHPIPSVPILEEKSKSKSNAGADARSKRPIYQNERFAVFEWMLTELMGMLGAHSDAFDFHEFFDVLGRQSHDQSLVIPKGRDANGRDLFWPWLQAQVLSEAQRRGLPMAITPSQPTAGKLTTRMAALVQKARAGDL